MNWKHAATFVVLSVLLGVGCAPKTPSAAARQFVEVVQKGDAKSYNKVMTPDAVKAATIYGEKLKQMLDAKGGIKSTKETINGNNAVVDITFKDGSVETFDLVKVNDKWKVTIDKK